MRLIFTERSRSVWRLLVILVAAWGWLLFLVMVLRGLCETK